VLSYNYLENPREDADATLDVDDEHLGRLWDDEAMIVTAEWKSYKVYSYKTMREAEDDFYRMRLWQCTRILYQRDGESWVEKDQKGPAWEVPTIQRLMKDFRPQRPDRGLPAMLSDLRGLFVRALKGAPASENADKQG